MRALKLAPVLFVVFFGCANEPLGSADAPLNKYKQTDQRRGDDKNRDFDTDEDGVLDAKDRCPISISMGREILQGCTVADVVLNPKALSKTFANVAARSRGELGAISDFEFGVELVNDLDEASNVMELLISRGAFCEAAESWSASKEVIDALSEKLGGALTELEIASSTSVGDEDGQVDKEHWHLTDANVAHAQAQGVLARVMELAQLRENVAGRLAELCSSTSDTVEHEGTIVAFDQARGLLRLEDDQLVLVPGSVATDDNKLLPGNGGQYLAKVIDDDVSVLVASEFEPQSVTELLKDFDAECAQLRFVPAQAPLLSMFPTVPIDYSPAGYENDGNYFLETEMRFALESFDCPLGDYDGVSLTADRYSVELTLSYRDTQNVQVQTTLAQDLDGSDSPVSLPSNLWASFYTYPLTAKFYRQTCSYNTLLPDLIAPNCSPREFLRDEVYPIQVRERGSRCSLGYQQTDFALDDDPYVPSWAQTSINHVYLTGAATELGAQVSVSAFAKTASGGAMSTQVVGLNEPFAIRSDTDFYPIYDGVGVANPAIAGVRRAAGVAWPRMISTRNGEAFSYVCEVPEVVRDVVGFCSAPVPDAFYKLPFFASGDINVGQGNNGAFTHQGGQKYAFDMAHEDGEGAWLVASRGGVVNMVNDTETNNCADFNCCPSNVGCPAGFQFGGQNLSILHQDGSIAWYAHFQDNSIIVAPGQYVNRGALLGRMGNTGNSTGPHVHAQVIGYAGSGQTIPIRFQYIDDGLQWCDNLQQGDEVYTTNL